MTGADTGRCAHLCLTGSTIICVCWLNTCTCIYLSTTLLTGVNKGMFVYGLHMAWIWETQ